MAQKRKFRGDLEVISAFFMWYVLRILKLNQETEYEA